MASSKKKTAKKTPAKLKDLKSKKSAKGGASGIEYGLTPSIVAVTEINALKSASNNLSQKFYQISSVLDRWGR